MRAIPTLLAAVFCGLLLAAAGFMARGEVVHERAEAAPPSLAQAAAMVGAAQNPKLSSTERTRLQAKAATAARNAAAGQGYSQEPTLRKTLAAMPVFLLILPLAGLPFTLGVWAVRRGRVRSPIGLSLVSAVMLAGWYLAVGGWWAQVNEDSPPKYVPPGAQDVSIAWMLCGGAVLIALVIFPLYVRITRRRPPEQSMEPIHGPPRGSTRIVR
jgi:hypothetical protein